MPRHRTLLLKLSGEALGGAAGRGFDPAAARSIAAQIIELTRGGGRVGVVVGGGNFFRGVNSADSGLQRTTVDAMGMLATVINALAFADVVRSLGGRAETFSAVGMEPLARRYSRREALEALDAGAAVVFGAGTGNPFFSTDTAAALRAVEIGADLLPKATKVDGVYDRDPARHAGAERFDTVSYAEVLEKGLAVMDATAVALCRENRLPVLVFNLAEPDALLRAAAGERVGTLMS